MQPHLYTRQNVLAGAAGCMVFSVILYILADMAMAPTTLEDGLAVEPIVVPPDAMSLEKCKPFRNEGSLNLKSQFNVSPKICSPDMSAVQVGCKTCERLLSEYACIPKWKNGSSMACPFPQADGRCGPSVFMIGPQKSGSSSLHNFAAKQEHFKSAYTKEVHYYDVVGGLKGNPYNASDHFPGYMSNFPYCTKCITGDFTPAYLLCPPCAAAVSDQWPEARIVLHLRDPVDRAMSHYSHDAYHWWRRPKRNHGTPRKTFEQDFQALVDLKLQNADLPHGPIDPNIVYDHWIHDKGENGMHYNHLIRGFYEPQIRQWRKHFPVNQILAIETKYLFDKQVQPCVLQMFMRFVGLPHPSHDSPNYNVDHLHLSAFKDEHYPHPSEEETAEAEEFLKQVYADHNSRLYNYLGRDLGWKK